MHQGVQLPGLWCPSYGHQGASAYLRRTRTAAAGGFDPSTVAGMVFWFKADALVLSNNDPVATWADSSGIGNDATNAASGERPLYKTNIVNSLPAVLFDGSDDQLQLAAIDLSGTSAVTIFAVAGDIGAGSDNVIYEFSDNSNSYTDSFTILRTSGNVVDSFFPGNAGYSEFATTGTLTTGFKLIAVILDKSLATNEATAWLNNDNSGSRPNNSNNTNAFGNRPSYIGKRESGGGLALNGYIAELLLYDNSLGVTDFDNVTEYLRAKYNLF